MMIRVLALDIDGVLNSERFLHARGCTTSELGTKYRQSHPLRMIDPVAVQRLNRVLAATGAVCVLSSAWRIIHELDAVQGYLEHHGFIGKLIDRTPGYGDLLERQAIERDGQRIVPGYCRGVEIQAWLDEPAVWTGTGFIDGGPLSPPRRNLIKRFAIVDDSDNMGHLKPYLVRTTWQEGLQDEHVGLLIKMLGGG